MKYENEINAVSQIDRIIQPDENFITAKRLERHNLEIRRDFHKEVLSEHAKLIVYCPGCGKQQQSKTTLSKTCSRCHKRFTIFYKNKVKGGLPNRIVSGNVKYVQQLYRLERNQLHGGL